jgi:hypothetical protein
MNKPGVLRLLGTILVVAAVIGFVGSILGLFAIVVVERQLHDGIVQTIDVLDQSLAATADGLKVADTALAQVSTTMTSTQQSLATVAKTVDESAPTLRSLSKTVGKDLPGIVTSTQRAVRSAQTSAGAVDGILAQVSRIPLLGLSRYRPEKPLADSLGDIAAAMDGLPKAIADAQTGLQAASGNAVTIKQDLGQLAASLGAIAGSLQEARGVVAQYQDVVVKLQAQAHRARERTPVWLARLRWFSWFVLLWLAVAQIAVFTQGLELISRSRTGAES